MQRGERAHGCGIMAARLRESTMVDRWLLLLGALVAAAGAIALLGWRFATAGGDEAAAVTVQAAQIGQAVLTFASLSVSAFLYVSRVPPGGILWWNRVRSRSISVSARLSMTFQPDERPLLADVEERLRRWNGSDRRFEVIARSADAAGALLKLDVHTQQLGRIVVDLLEDSSERQGRSPEDFLAVTLTVPDTRQDLKHLVELVRGELEQLIAAVSPVLGDTTGVRLDADLDARRNPFYGVYIRDDIARTGVTAFNVQLAPGTGSTVEVGSSAISIRSRNRPDFVRVAGAMLGLRPIGT